MTKEEFSHQLCKRFRKPIVSTSANVSGKKSPATFREIDNAILESVDYVVNYRQNDDCALKSSEIIKLSKSGIIKIIRK